MAQQTLKMKVLSSAETLFHEVWLSGLLFFLKGNSSKETALKQFKELFVQMHNYGVLVPTLLQVFSHFFQNACIPKVVKDLEASLQSDFGKRCPVYLDT